MHLYGQNFKANDVFFVWSSLILWNTSFQNLRAAVSALCCGGAAASGRGGPGGGTGGEERQVP